MVAARRALRRGPVFIAEETGVPARTISRILARRGELIHLDVKKLGKVPDGGGWRAHGRAGTATWQHKNARIGYDYIHVAIDDHSRLAYAEICPGEKGTTAAAFLACAAAYFAARGITRIERVITGNAFAYRHSTAFAQAVAALGARHKFIRPRCPWQHGKAEQFNRTLATEWAYRQVFTSTAQRTAALPSWLEFYNTQRQHTALGGHPPTSRLSPTS